MEFLDKKLDDFVTEHSSNESELLKELNRETWSDVLQPRMLSGHLQGRVLSMFSRMIRPKQILEIGTYTGYSALCLAEGLESGGMLHTIDINEELEDLVQRYISKSGFSEQIKTYTGSALDVIPTIDASFDLVFIDADKENYSNYYDLVFDQVRMGGFIIADNVLWSGKVIEQLDDKDMETKALVDFSQKVQKDNRVENVLFPVRDGLMVVQKVVE